MSHMSHLGGGWEVVCRVSAGALCSACLLLPDHLLKVGPFGSKTLYSPASRPDWLAGGMESGEAEGA